MKNIRLLTLVLTAIYLFTFAAAAAFAPSIEYKAAPEIVEAPADDDNRIVITSIAQLIAAVEEIHDEIEAILTEAHEELKENTYEELIPDFAEVWKEVTGGAPADHAVVSDLFDVRPASSLEEGDAGKKTFTVKIKVQGLTKDDKFVLVARPEDAHDWSVVKHASKAAAALNKYAQAASLSASFADNGFGFVDTVTAAAPAAANVEYTMGDDDVLTITSDTPCVFAVIRDSEAAPAVAADAPASPQTAANTWFMPAIAGAILFAGVAFVAVRKLTKREEA